MNMSALSVLYLVLPFVGVFALHEIEELATTSRWSARFNERRASVSPLLWLLLGRFYKADKREMWLTAIEQLLLLVVITEYSLTSGSAMSELLWMTAFLAYSVHALLHIVLAVAVRGYFPGLVTAVLSLPFVVYGIHSIALVHPWSQLIALSLAGVSLAIVNLLIVKSVSSNILTKD